MPRSTQRLSAIVLLVAMLLVACQEKDTYSNKNLSMEAFSAMKTPSFMLSAKAIRKELHALAKADNGSFTSDKTLRHYYQGDRPLLWASRHGIDERADTLLHWLERVGESGIRQDIYRVKKMRKCLDDLRSLDLSSHQDINRLSAWLEYNLTRAYLRYAACQHFGYINPAYTLNHCAVKDSDSTHVSYFRVFDVKMAHPDADFFQQAFGKLSNDSLPLFLRDIQPRGTLYRKLLAELNNGKHSDSRRRTLICNLERCRWQTAERPDDHQKYILVNIPAFRLYAYGEDSVLTMRVGCGTRKTRTPILHSFIHRMDLNPMWFVPKSIAKGIAHSYGYLRRNNMFVLDKKEGRLPPERASYQRIMDGQQSIVQRGGPGNSLGRIIFRFDNNFSVYLHSTNTPWFFQRQYRAVSHGCVRVEEPYRLAVFLLKEKDEELTDRIKYSMEADLNPNDDTSEEAAKRKPIDYKRLINSVKVEPHVPVFISYFTCYPTTEGTLAYYDDVYGYDQAIIKEMNAYIDTPQKTKSTPQKTKDAPQKTRP